MDPVDELQSHKNKCDKCIESGPGQWDLCETGQELLRHVLAEDLKNYREPGLPGLDVLRPGRP